jgi:hypothetical protein
LEVEYFGVGCGEGREDEKKEWELWKIVEEGCRYYTLRNKERKKRGGKVSNKKKLTEKN